MDFYESVPAVLSRIYPGALFASLLLSLHAQKPFNVCFNICESGKVFYWALDQNQLGTACNGVVCAEMRTQLQGANKKTKQAIF